MRTVVTFVLGLAVALGGTALEGGPAHASSVSRVTLRVPVAQTDSGSVVLHGRVVGHLRKVRKVRVEVRSGAGRWRLLDRVRVRHGAYKARVPLRAESQRVRVGARGHYSAARTVAAKPTPKAPVRDACGVRPMKSDGTSWSCTFVDEFNGTSLDRTKWLPQRGFPTGVDGARACALDDPSTIRVADGVLNLSVVKLPAPMSCRSNSAVYEAQYGAASVSTYHLFSQQYGRFEARMKSTATAAPGLQEAFWLWPDDRVASTDAWPVAGEIDISETYSKYPSLSIPFLHYSADQGGPQPGTNTAWDCVAQRGVWNTYGLEWSPSRLEIFVNGKSCLVNTSGDQAFRKAYIVAFTAALGVQENAYAGAAPIPATTSVDYIHVWR